MMFVIFNQLKISWKNDSTNKHLHTTKIFHLDQVSFCNGPLQKIELGSHWDDQIPVGSLHFSRMENNPSGILVKMAYQSHCDWWVDFPVGSNPYPIIFSLENWLSLYSQIYTFIKAHITFVLLYSLITVGSHPYFKWDPD